MTMLDPTLIFGVERSGTTMVSAIFHAHGFWFGKCPPASKKYPEGFFENLKFRHARIDYFQASLDELDVRKGVEPRKWFKEYFKKVALDEGYPGGHWAVKQATQWYPAWYEFEDSPIVLVKRRPEDIVRSIMSKNAKGKDEEYWFDFIASTYELMEDIKKERQNVVEVRSDELIEGDLSSMEAALDASMIQPDVNLIESKIHRQVWKA